MKTGRITLSIDEDRQMFFESARIILQKRYNEKALKRSQGSCLLHHLGTGIHSKDCSLSGYYRYNLQFKLL